MNPWYTPRPNLDLPPSIDPHSWAESMRASNQFGDAALVESLADHLYGALLELSRLKAELATVTQERDRLLAWQTAAFQTVKAWSRVGDLVPGSFKVPGTRLADCTHAYVDHLREENRTLAKELLNPVLPPTTITFADGETEWRNP